MKRRYFCELCKKQHREGSKVYKEHLKHAKLKPGDTVKILTKKQGTPAKQGVILKKEKDMFTLLIIIPYGDVRQYQKDELVKYGAIHMKTLKELQKQVRM